MPSIGGSSSPLGVVAVASNPSSTPSSGSTPPLPSSSHEDREDDCLKNCDSIHDHNNSESSRIPCSSFVIHHHHTDSQLDVVAVDQLQHEGGQVITAVTAASPFAALCCALCCEIYQEPKVLSCFHTFCKLCLEKLIDDPSTLGDTVFGGSFPLIPQPGGGKRYIICPTCRCETTLHPFEGVDSLLSDYAALRLLALEDEKRRRQRSSSNQQHDKQENGSPITNTGSAQRQQSFSPPSLPPCGIDSGSMGSMSTRCVLVNDNVLKNGTRPSSSMGDTSTTDQSLSGSPSQTDANYPTGVTFLDMPEGQQLFPCTGCKTKDSPAVMHCLDCKNALCANCVAAHRFMHCFERHRLVDMSLLNSPPLDLTNNGHCLGGDQSPTAVGHGIGNATCPRHDHEILRYFCINCDSPVCKLCTQQDHQLSAGHRCLTLEEAAPGQLEYVQKLLDEAKCKQTLLMQSFKLLDAAGHRLNMNHEKAQNLVQETQHLLIQALDEFRQKISRDLDSAFASKQTALGLIERKVQQNVERLSQTLQFGDRLMRYASPYEVLMFKRQLNDKLRHVLQLSLDEVQLLAQQYERIDFVPNVQAARLALNNTFGYVRQGQHSTTATSTSAGLHRHASYNPTTTHDHSPLIKAPVKPISRPVVGSLPSQNSSPPVMLGSSFPGGNGIMGPGGTGGLGSGVFIPPLLAQSSSSSALSPSGGLLMNGCVPGLTQHPQQATFIVGSASSSHNATQFSPPPIIGEVNLHSPSENQYGLMNINNVNSQLFGDSSCLQSAFSSLSLDGGASSGGLATTSCWSSQPQSAGTNGDFFSSLKSTSSVLDHHTQQQQHHLSGQIPNCSSGGGGNNPFFNGVAGSTLNPNAAFFDGTNSSLLSNSLATGLMNAASSLFPPKSQIKRHKMIYHCKFGEFGVMEGQFTEPSGVAVNAQNDVIVADTNNHRIQIFDKEGRFKFQFGECGKRDGQLLYPNRVAVNKATGDIIVTERSPTHQIQVYNQYGQFLRKFGANILQHPRGVTVDYKGRVVVVECKVMRVIIFDMMGNVVQKFGCSKYLEFPNGVVTNDKQEIFISDNRAHCVKVFSYEGAYLRQIGGEGLTNYPIGVGVNSQGDVVVADNHNNFNLTVFQQDGTLVNALESKVKHAQCFDVALLDDGSIVLASKDYRLYIYRYAQLPPPLPVL